MIHYLLINLAYLLETNFKLGGEQKVWVYISVIINQHDCIPQIACALPRIAAKCLSVTKCQEEKQCPSQI